jgi:hypothetical protein
MSVLLLFVPAAAGAPVRDTSKIIAKQPQLWESLKFGVWCGGGEEVGKRFFGLL